MCGPPPSNPATEFCAARDRITAEKSIQSSSLRLSNLCGVTSSGKAGGPILSRDEPASCRCLAQLRKRNAFAGMRKRLVQQRFERMGCPKAINGLHRDFQGPIHAWKVTVGDLLAEQSFDWGSERGCDDVNRRRPSKRGKQRFKALSPNANSSAPRPAADHPPLHHGGTRSQPPRCSHLPPAHTPPPQAHAEQEDEDEKLLGWFVRQMLADVISRHFSGSLDS